MLLLSEGRCELHLFSLGRKNKEAAHIDLNEQDQGDKQKQVDCFFPILLQLWFNM